MTNTPNQPFDAIDENGKAIEVNGQLQQHTDQFINNDQALDSSIGSGTDDEGINADDQPREDEFGEENAVAGFNNHTSAAGAETDKGASGKSKQPDHGLVEEGPGPDA